MGLFDISEIMDMKGVKLVGLNIRSIKAQGRMVALNQHLAKADIISINESWLYETDCDNQYSLTGHVCFRLDRCANAGGIICYISNDFAPYTTVRTNMNVMTEDAEIVYKKREDGRRGAHLD